MEKPEIIIQNLAHFNGSESLYTHTVGGSSILYTEGILYVAETCECYWLLDFILSHQNSPILNQEDFQIWNIIKHENKWIISCCDDDNNLILDQDIEFLDFPLNSIKLWYVEGTLLLPSEY